MTIDKYILVFFIGNLFYACKGRQDENLILDEHKLTYVNSYTIDETICKAKKLPLSHFKIEYPSVFNVSYINNSSNHIVLSYIEFGEITEELSLGSTSINSDNSSLTLDLLSDFVRVMKQESILVDSLFLGRKKFGRNENSIFEGVVKFPDDVNSLYNGEYKMILVVPDPPLGSKKLCSPIFTFIANEKSKIDSFSDFSTKGEIGKVWQTFKFIDP